MPSYEKLIGHLTQDQPKRKKNCRLVACQRRLRILNFIWRSRDIDRGCLTSAPTPRHRSNQIHHAQLKPPPYYREWCVPPADLKTRIISIHLMSLEEQREASRRMQSEVVPLVLTPSSDLDLDPAMKARLLEMEKMIDELERVIDLEAIFPNSKEPGRPGGLPFTGA